MIIGAQIAFLCSQFQFFPGLPLVVGGKAESARVIVYLHMTSDPNNAVIHSTVLLSLSYSGYIIAKEKYDKTDFISKEEPPIGQLFFYG